jgi:membrane dipeptidase
MGSWKGAFVLLVASFLLCASCDSGRISSATMRQIRQAQEQMLTVDAHIDAGLLLRGSRDSQALFRRMKAGGIDAALFFIPAKEGDRTLGDAWSARKPIEAAIDRIRRHIEGSSGAASLALTPADAYQLEKEGRIAAYIGLGSGEAIGADISLIRSYHARGVRILSLCSGTDNLICDSATGRGDPQGRGLTDFGRRVVAECNRVGVLIDVAGCSEKSFFDVLEVSRSPVIMTRAAARALYDRPDNPSDEMIRAIAEKGGAVFICLIPKRLERTAARSEVSIADVVDHIDHVLRLAGVEAAGIGSGFGGGGGIPGIRSPGGMLHLTVELLRRGYSEREIEAVWGGNIMSVFKQVTSLAGER